MADSKQAGHLNGAFYGPPIPPQPRAYRSVGSRSSCCCGPCCILCNLFKFLLSLVVILGIVVLVLWLVFRPHEIKARVDDATLSQFNFSSADGNTLVYDLRLNMSLRNPNRRISLYYDYLEARGYYDDQRFGFAVLPTFFQGHKNTTVLSPVLQGSNSLLNSGSMATTYAREKGEGFYYVDVKLYTKLRLKVWWFKIHYNRQHIDCSLKLPAPGTSGTFEATDCDVDIF